MGRSRRSSPDRCTDERRRDRELEQEEQKKRRYEGKNSRRGRSAFDREMPFMDSLGREPQEPDVRNNFSSPGGAMSWPLRGPHACGDVAPLGLFGARGQDPGAHAPGYRTPPLPGRAAARRCARRGVTSVNPQRTKKSEQNLVGATRFCTLVVQGAAIPDSLKALTSSVPRQLHCEETAFLSRDHIWQPVSEKVRDGCSRVINECGASDSTIRPRRNQR